VDVEALLADLDPDQRRAVLSDGAPLCIVAPAGSGKTRVLTRRIARRIADGSADASHVLVVTFTRRAAGELVRRLRVLGPRVTVTAGTFHGIAYRLARQRWDDIGRRPPALAPDRRRLVQEVLGSTGRPPRPDVVREVTAEIDWARSQRLEPAAYAAAASAARRTSLSTAEVAEHYGAYEALKRRRRLVDFDDLLSQGIAELQRDPAYAAAVRWRFRHLFVDEFQDVNPLQHALLDAWVGARDDLCVVGDPQQAIYGWTGADGRWLEDFADHHPGATVVHLGQSHRSSPQIVNVGHAVLTGRSEGAPMATRPDGPPPRSHRFPDAQAEAAAVPVLARDARPPGGRWGAIAVLARTNAQLEPVATALQRAGVPFRSRATGEADDAVSALLASVGRMPERGTLRAWLDEHALGADPLPTGVQEAVEDLLLQDPDASGADLRVWLRTGGRGDGPLLEGDEDSVTLSTFHAAKGLEWPTVIVVGAVPGLVPHASARTPQALDEERRLFHVAVTRAQRDLVVTWYGDTGSPWLAALDEASDPLAPPPAVDRPATARPDPVVEGLHAWRRQAARAARVDETAVLADRTLAAIAAADPSTLEELADVPGVGPLMARRHGPRILAALAAGRSTAAQASPPPP
jgi:DNA helicase-2/ATP-dependent DNA helicase PcrA